MTWIVEAVHPKANDVPVHAEVATEREAEAIAQLFTNAGCFTGYWSEGSDLMVALGPLWEA